MYYSRAASIRRPVLLFLRRDIRRRIPNQRRVFVPARRSGRNEKQKILYVELVLKRLATPAADHAPRIGIMFTDAAEPGEGSLSRSRRW
jgi:hypothetical protein